MSITKCPDCGSEYYLNHIKHPIKDEGGNAPCNCGKILYSWGKGTDDYILIPIEQHRRWLQLEQQKRDRAPACPDCKIKMDLKHGTYGYFWGCSRFPKCTKTKKIRESDKDLLK